MDKDLKHRPVIETQRDTGDISEDPAMQKLARLYEDMTEEEQARTIDYLTGRPAARQIEGEAGDGSAVEGRRQERHG